MHDCEDVVQDILTAGAKGYLLKADANNHLTAAVQALGRHEAYIPAGSPRIPRHAGQPAFGVAPGTPDPSRASRRPAHSGGPHQQECWSKARSRRLSRTLIALVCATLVGTAAQGTEGGASLYLAGLRGPGARIVPPPGFYFSNDFLAYSGELTGGRRVQIGGAVLADTQVEIRADFLTGTWVTPLEILGGNLALGVSIGFSRRGSRSRLTARPVPRPTSPAEWNGTTTSRTWPPRWLTAWRRSTQQ
jgi:hypothetical protein